MKFKPNPLLYGANEDFYSSFKLVITMCDTVDHKVLSSAVANAMLRYPYFSVSVMNEDDCLVLQHNPNPVPVFSDGRCAVLGSEETNGHLIAFGCEGNRIILNASHYMADGMGIDPLLKTVLYLYISQLYGADGLDLEKIQMQDAPVSSKEYEYPFDNLPSVEKSCAMTKVASDDVYKLDASQFDGDGMYAYHLHIPSVELMKIANPSDGSPVSFLSVLLYRALHSLDDAIEKTVVVHVQHQYRAALNVPLNRHSLVSYVPVVLSLRIRNWHIERQNTVMRGQIIIGSERSADIEAVNRLIMAIPDGIDTSLAEKKMSMSRYIESSIEGKTFGISYVGKMNWCGLDRYVEDIHAYIGEKHTRDMLLIEVMTVKDFFTINFMQSGGGECYVDAFMEQLKQFGIPVTLVGKERYTLCDTRI